MQVQDEIFSINSLKSWYIEDQLVLKDVSFSLNENENLALVGANGSGKSTLIRTLMDIHPDYEVKAIRFDGEDIAFSDQELKLNRIAVFTEDDSFKYWNFTEYNDFLHKSYNKKIDDEYIDYMIDGFNFEEHYEKPSKDLSMGNKKKYFITAALSLKLSIVFLDEPVDGLDFESTAFLYKLMKEYKEFGSIFMSTHILESINESCDNLVLLQDGHLSEKISVDKALSMDDIMNIFKGENRD